MQAPAPIAMRLHWIPIPASWVVSVSCILLAALPHQIPSTIRTVLQNPIGAITFAAAAVWTTTRVPHLGAAMFILLAGLWITGRASVENFENPFMIKDTVTKPQKRKWLQEDIMTEDPHSIQERTDNPTLTQDEVTGPEKQQWFSEEVLDEHPTMIQERPVWTGIASSDHE
jgi:hypothetical protein